MVECPSCKCKEYTETDEISCPDCKKTVKICYCKDCMTEFYSCGHLAPEKRQCSVTSSKLKRNNAL